MVQQTQTWGFLTNHALVLIYVVRHQESTVREIAAGVRITERATLAILRQLSDDEIIDRHRDGRRNTYAVNFDHLAAYRREGTVALTPRAFVDGLIQTLLSISHYHAPVGKNGAPPDDIDSAAGSEVRHLGLLHQSRAAAAGDRDGPLRSRCARSPRRSASRNERSSRS